MKRNDEEHREQSALFERCLRQKNMYPGIEKIYSVPNAGQRHPAVGAKMKREGLRAGFPDLGLPIARGGYHGLFIEMKAKGGKLRENQREWALWLKEEGFKVETCWSAEEAWQLIMRYYRGKCIREDEEKL